MALEDLSGTDKFIDDLVITNPVGSTDPMSDVDGHITGVKNVLNNSFEFITGKVTSTHTELNFNDGLTSAAVGLTDTQTLTNKTLTSPELSAPTMTNPQIHDTSADHQYIVGVSELAADRTISLPLLAGNDTFTFNAFAATLTNKTIDCDNNTVTNVGAGELETGSTEDTQTGLLSTPYVIPSGLHWIQKDGVANNLIFEVQMSASWRTVATEGSQFIPHFMWSDGTNMRLNSDNDSVVARLLSMD